MKKVIRKTGEIIDVISYSGGCDRSDYDSVSFIDSNGNERIEQLNYYWDLEDIGNEPNEKKYWENFRNEAALKILTAKLTNENNKKKDILEEINLSILYANHLIKELKNNNLKIENKK